ncbi:MAG: hypothetical protein AAB091_07690 [Elusimicrobiota bacterium]
MSKESPNLHIATALRAQLPGCSSPQIHELLKVAAHELEHLLVDLGSCFFFRLG